MLPSDSEITLPAGLPVAPASSQHVGPYRLLDELGRGGMGTVYLAVRTDEGFERRVALKVLKRGLDTDAIVHRFRTERQILARLTHPYISTFIDGGTTDDGLPYFAMEYVDGRPIDVYCDAGRLDTTARLRLFLKICAAVQYAHQNLVIHCDIKPANVLVTADGVPKLLDFGIAKLLTAAGVQTMALTLDGAPLLTPEYASPEQVRGEAVTTATDVYALGVLLYELLTGRRPYDLSSRSPMEVARIVCDSVPERPSTAVMERHGLADVDQVRRRLAGDLDTIVLKALNKDPARRYASVDQLAEDIRRHLTGQPVLARPDTFRYRLSTFVRRHRTPVAAAVLVLLALVAGIVVATWQARIAQRERALAERRFDDVRQLANVALLDIHDAIRDLPGATSARQLLVSKGLQYLDRLSRDAGDRADLRRELAVAYVKIGDVQGRPLNPNLGDTAGALESYRKALAIYDSISADSSPDPSLRRELARAHQRLSEVLSATGDTPGALVQARRSLELLQQPAAGAQEPEGPVAAEVGRELAASYTRVGDLLSATGDTTTALEHRRRALAVMQSVEAIDPDNPETLRQLGSTYTKLGNQLGNPNFPNVGDAAAAVVEIERAVEVFARGLAAHPSSAAFKRSLAIAHSNAADVLRALSRPADALARQRTSVDTFEALAKADPANASARNDLAIGLSKIAEMLNDEGRSQEAIREFERAVDIHVALSNADPANTSMKLEVAADINRLATAQVKARQRAAALANHTRAVEMMRELQRANPANVELRVALGLALAGRADALVELTGDTPSRTSEDLANAERDYAESVAIFTELQQNGSIQGTDLEILENNRKALARVQALRRS